MMTADRQRVDALLDRWEESRRQGAALTPEALCADAPELLDFVREQIEGLEAMDWLDTEPAPPCPDRASREGRSLRPIRELAVPETLASRYRLDNLIAEGGFGQVWRATDTALDRPVAVKLTTIDCVGEARRVARLRHEGIVSVHDVGHQDGFCYIVFDYVEGRDLAWQLRTRRFASQEAAEMAARVADYLHYAHGRGIIHRDIKPANILLEPDGRPVLADFGIAVTAAELAGETVMTAGTLAYMAPEQLRESDAAAADARTDVYSLGVVLYQMLTGRLPFEAGTLWDLRVQILAGNPAPPEELVPDLPPSLTAICRRCLALAPEDRFPTAESLAAALRRVARP